MNVPNKCVSELKIQVPSVEAVRIKSKTRQRASDKKEDKGGRPDEKTAENLDAGYSNIKVIRHPPIAAISLLTLSTAPPEPFQLPLQPPLPFLPFTLFPLPYLPQDRSLWFETVYTCVKISFDLRFFVLDWNEAIPAKHEGRDILYFLRRS